MLLFCPPSCQDIPRAYQLLLVLLKEKKRVNHSIRHLVSSVLQLRLVGGDIDNLQRWSALRFISGPMFLPRFSYSTHSTSPHNRTSRPSDWETTHCSFQKESELMSNGDQKSSLNATQLYKTPIEHTSLVPVWSPAYFDQPLLCQGWPQNQTETNSW